jgi:hypothetical protein
MEVKIMDVKPEEKVEKKKKAYVNNADFLKALVDYKQKCKENRDAGKEDPPIPNYIGECFMKIAEGFSHKPNYINYTYRDEMVSDAIENCLMYFENFDPEKSSNPFAYFTQIVYFAFLRRIAKEKKQLYIKYKSTENFGIMEEYEIMDPDTGSTKQFEMYENISEFIGNFEEVQKEKKRIRKVIKRSKEIDKGLEKFMEE